MAAVYRQQSPDELLWKLLLSLLKQENLSCETFMWTMNLHLSPVKQRPLMFCRHQEALAKSNIRLHKTATNNRNVMQAFPPEDRAKDLKDLDLGTEPLPLQKSLGLSWNIEMDHFTFSVSREDKNVTRRGILSTVNSLFHHKWEKPNESFQSNSTTGMRHCHCQNRNTGNFGETQWWS